MSDTNPILIGFTLEWKSPVSLLNIGLFCIARTARSDQFPSSSFNESLDIGSLNPTSEDTWTGTTDRVVIV